MMVSDRVSHRLLIAVSQCLLGFYPTSSTLQTKNHLPTKIAGGG
ncbi:hypothetical protein IMCC1989_264 [gamma proteobacterium IMCC1989]|nr:hypothetical protein IMCC1989_264 [gamma proteobacterium IMCC1989]